MNNDDKDCIFALAISLCFSLAVVMLVCAIAYEASAAEINRWAVVKWDRGIAVMATFEAQSEKDCDELAKKRNLNYIHAQMPQRWSCVDLATINDKGA